MLGSNPGPDADLMMTLIYRQSFSNNLFGFGAAASTLLMLAMGVWVLIWYRAFKRDLEVEMSSRLVNQGLDVLTWLVLAVMLAPIGWLVRQLAADRRPALAPAPTTCCIRRFTAFSRMWQSVDFERYLIN